MNWNLIAGNDQTTASKSKEREMHVCQLHLEIGRHEGVVHDHHYVFMVLVHQLRAGLDINNLHRGVGRRLNPHQLSERKKDSKSFH